MVTKLELAVDSSGVKAGLVDANRALDETAKKADRAEKEVRDLGDNSAKAGKNMSAAFAATGGGLAVTHGLSGIADGFRRADGSMAAFAASQALLDMGRMAEDMKGVAGATGEATSMFSKMGAIMKAHPIMTIATLLAAAATAMSLFGGETEEAADDMERLADAMEKVRIGREASQLLGISQLSPAQQEQSNVRQAAEMFVSRGATYGSLAQSLGRTPEELLQRQVMGGVNVPSQAPTKIYRDEMGLEYDVPIPYEDRQVSAQAAQAILRSIYGEVSAEVTKLQAKTPGGGGLPPSSAAVTNSAQSISDQITAWYGAPLGPPQPTSAASLNALSPQQLAGMSGTLDPQFNLSSFRQQSFGGGGALISGERYAEVETERNQAIAEANQNMQELIMKGEQFGQTIGDAFMRVADGTMTAKQAMAELVRTFAQMGAQSVFKSIGGAVAGGFGTTQTQGNTNIDPGPIPLNS